MKYSGDTTHPQYATSPQNFRAQATGIGQSQAMSRSTGAARAAEVVEHMPPEQRRAVPPSAGYPLGAAYEGRAEGAGGAEDAT